MDVDPLIGGEPPIRVMRPADLPAARRLSDQAGWNQSSADWRRLLTWDPRGCFVLERDGRLAGTVTTTRYGADLAWIGMLLVDQDQRRQGWGRRLLSHAVTWLHVVGARSVLLDATPQGRPLYEQLGFRELYGLDRWQGLAAASAHVPAAIRPLQTDDLRAASALDAAAFGVERERVLCDLLAAPGGQGYVAGSGDAATGYVLLRPGARSWYIGPLVARNSAAAGALLDAALATLRGQPVVLDVPRSNPAAGSLVAARGLTVARSLTRMVLGGPTPAADPTLSYAIAGLETG